MAETKTQLLQITPGRELVFQGPFTDIVTAHMKLRNPTNDPIVFKVKTTAPKQYCVRPNSGLLKPGEDKTVTVMLQPMEGIPADAARHKFMVQSCVSPCEDIAELESIWKVIDSSELTYSKLMVTFVEKKSLDGDAGKSGVVEEPFASSQAQEVGSSFSRPVQASESGTVASLRKSLSIALEEKEDLLRKVAGLENEKDSLMLKNRTLQHSNQAGGAVDGGPFPTLQVILMAIAAILVGLIVGKLL